MRAYTRDTEHPEVLRARLIGLAAHRLYQTNPDYRLAGYAARRAAVAPMVTRLLWSLGYEIQEYAS